ncbi:hypothetical protein FOBRF1_007424 [Fusarium oxysporum]
MDAAKKQSEEAEHCEVISPAQTSTPTSQDLINMSPTNLKEESHDAVLQKLGLLDQTLNPSSPSFDFQRWSQALVNLRSKLDLPTPPRSGFAFKNLSVYGSGPAVEQQNTLWTLLTQPFSIRSWFCPKETKVILTRLNGVVEKGELLLVLGRPGSGCSTFLKTITGEMQSLEIDSDSILHYSGTANTNQYHNTVLASLGIRHQVMARDFKGELIYNQEVDEHLPYLTVGQTLEFAAAMRTPRARLPGITRKDRISHVVQVMLTVFGLSHTKHTIVGNDYIRGVSGGERKRVSIAETALFEAAISAWDNSTRGLDAESALHFVSRLRTLSDLTQSSTAAAIYQSSQSIVNLFDKILVLYEGRGVFFGRAALASAYFERMGWYRHPRQTAGDFLTGITNPEQRQAKEGHENSVPRTSEEFETHWRDSPDYSHLWRNLGIILGFVFFFFFTYLLVTELNVNSSVGPEVPVFLRGRLPKADSKLKARMDIERPSMVNSAPIEIAPSEPIPTKVNRSVFSWRKLTFDVMIKGNSRRLLDEPSGWVKPGSLVALMGVSGAGKTTLLNALAQRMSSGQVKGEFYVDGKPLPASFKSDVGYVQQQDVHLETSTVREALQFSAMLRQPRNIPKSQKLAFVEETIHLVGMDEFADAIIGFPGKGLNAEQRKRLSIGVELAGKPSLLLFLDEPTSGLDSQSSEAILSLLQKLAMGGLGILCTIHQPSAMLFQRFDRLLLMARGGKVAYFGDIGENSETVLGYFGDRAPRRCNDDENPAEYLLDMIGNSKGDKFDWPQLWNASQEANQVATELERISESSSPKPSHEHDAQTQQRGAYRFLHSHRYQSCTGA